MPTLMETDMTNKPMRLKSLQRDNQFVIVNLIRLHILQISHKGKTNTNSLGQEL